MRAHTTRVLFAEAAALGLIVLGTSIGPATTPQTMAAGAASSTFRAVPTGGFAIAPGDSSVKFTVPDNRGGFVGHTTQVSGRVEVEAAGAESYAARITAAVNARTLTTDNAVRDKAMHATFLQTETYPAITFTGTAAARPGLGVRPFPATIHGRLTIRDVTRDAEFTATSVALANEYVADGTATIRMADYGIPYPRAFIFVARDPVTVTLHIVARTPP